ncbi:hypothetical protein CISG_05728 [Coccidioides immitis RMSCC 3703]|uniref:Uncharacterized protein n=1 Tax=Coccidioides immitis RMSCC 3703 TaxID=454286 RepID=A0A0J8QX53_COCIT|nr:hypothetical protein CISG_05728 [Coccidioides immitis RMSCC 3703]
MAAGAEITQLLNSINRAHPFERCPSVPVLTSAEPQNNSESKRRPSERHYDGSFDGEAIYEYFGNRVMKGHNTLGGRPVTVKFKTMGFFWQLEADMIAYTHSQNLLAPTVWECCQVDRHQITMIADFVPSDPLDRAWPTLNNQQHTSIREQLVDHLFQLMHPAIYWTCQSPAYPQPVQRHCGLEHNTPYSQLRIPGLERRESFLEVPRSPEDEIMPVRGRKLCFPVDLSLLSARTCLSSGRLLANSQLQQAGVVQDLPDCQMQDFYHSAGFVHRPKVQLRPAP